LLRTWTPYQEALSAPAILLSMASPGARDYYSILGIAASATTEEIRAAFIIAARASHPDKQSLREAGSVGSREPASAVDFVAVRNAWDTLGDPDRRAAYDRFLAEQGGGTSDPAGPGFGAGSVRSQRWPIIPISDEICEDEMEEADEATDDGDLLLTHPCRCGSHYSVMMSKLHAAPKTAGVIAQCNGCSLYIRFLPASE
jgi:curved DNA-binding protein CbpA